MNPEAQNAALAEFCGWYKYGSPDGPNVWFSPSGECAIDPLNYHGSLDALRECEARLTDEQREDYGAVLGHILFPTGKHIGNTDRKSICLVVTSIASATSQKKAEAILKTIGKWEDA